MSGDNLAFYRDTLGFDQSERIGPFVKGYRIRCSQCAALVVNGVPTHETGCPNMRAARERIKRRKGTDDDE